MGRRVRGWLAVAAVALFASSYAAAAPVNGRETARRLFEEAAALEAAEQWSEAIPKLRSALELVETPGLEYHLAYCLEQQGKLTEALVHYARAEGLISAGARAPDVEQLLATRQAALKARMPKITLVLPTDPAPSALWIDGEEHPPLTRDEPLVLNAGAHRIELRAASRDLSLVREVTIKEGQHLTLQLEWPPRRAPPLVRPQAAKSASPPSEPEPEASSNVARTVVLIGSATLAVAGVGWGIAFTRAADMKADKAGALKDELRDDQRCAGATKHPDCGALYDAANGEHKYRNLALGSFVAGGVFAAATVGTWFLWKPSSEAPKAVGFGVAPTASGWALRASGSF